MLRKLKYIILFLFYLCVNHSKAIHITIDSTFSDKDIYNSILEHKTILNHFEIEIDIKNQLQSEQQLYLSIINPTLNKISISNDTSTIILGDLIRFTKRKFKHNNHIYPILLQANESKHLKITIFKQWQAVNFRINLSTENHFVKTTNHDNFFSGIFYGIIFMYMLMLICCYIFSKSNFFQIYLVINGFMMLLFLQYSGIGYQYIWFYSATIEKHITVFAVIGYFTTHVYFIKTFFTIELKNNISGFILRIFFIIVAIFGIITIFQLYNRSYGYIHPNIYYLLITSLVLIYGLTVISLCIYTYIQSKRRESIWVLIGMILHIANWMIFINNEYAMVKPLNYITNWKLFSSYIFVPQINYYITMVEVFTITVFIAINYHNLLRENIISTKRLEFLQKRNINTFVLGQEEEREKISNQIGVEISKDIEQLKLSLLNLQHADEKKIIPSVLKDIDKTLEDISNITSNYVAPDMQQMKLTEIITTATEKVFLQTNMQFDFNKIPNDLQLNPVANINLFRVLQEISNNIIKHANAKNVAITTIKDNKSLQIKITDDGVGFSNFAPKSKGIGLLNIESRINSLNGNFYILSNVKTGSTIHLIMPLKDIC